MTKKLLNIINQNNLNTEENIIEYFEKNNYYIKRDYDLYIILSKKNE